MSKRCRYHTMMLMTERGLFDEEKVIARLGSMFVRASGLWSERSWIEWWPRSKLLCTERKRLMKKVIRRLRITFLVCKKTLRAQPLSVFYIGYDLSDNSCLEILDFTVYINVFDVHAKCFCNTFTVSRISFVAVDNVAFFNEVFNAVHFCSCVVE